MVGFDNSFDEVTKL